MIEMEQSINKTKEFSTLVQKKKEFKIKHDWVGKVINCESCSLNYTIGTNGISTNFVEIETHHVKLKESEKKDKYFDLPRGLENLINIEVTVTPIITGLFNDISTFVFFKMPNKFS